MNATTKKTICYWFSYITFNVLWITFLYFTFRWIFTSLLT